MRGSSAPSAFTRAVRHDPQAFRARGVCQPIVVRHERDIGGHLLPDKQTTGELNGVAGSQSMAVEPARRSPTTSSCSKGCAG